MQRSAIALPKGLDASSTLATTISSRPEKLGPEHFQQDDIGVEVLDDHISFEFELIRSCSTITKVQVSNTLANGLVEDADPFAEVSHERSTM